MVGRPSRYDWDDKKDICYKLFVEEKRTPGQIVKYFASHFSVPESEIPSARLFRRQFTEKWHFPPRQPHLPKDSEPVVIARIRELWEQNLPVSTIRETLGDEGWELGDNEFQRLRKENGLVRRGQGGGAYDTVSAKGNYKGKRKRKAGEAALDLDQDAVLDEQISQAQADANPASALLALQNHPPPGLTPDEISRRQQRLQQVQHESDAALASRKRRRRIRGYGHLPPDAPGLAPRYSSETTLDECKAFLGLSNEMYLSIRQSYEALCHEMGIERKKGSVETGLWQASKDRLVRENMHLSAVMHPLQANLDKKAIALDVLCADVTKRLRDSGKKMTLAQANNALGLNPSDSKSLRRVLYDILVQDQYTTRLACGEEHWNELRQTWYAASPLLQQVVWEGDPFKLRCVDILCRDACKRFNDDSIRKDPTRRQYQQSMYGPGPGSIKANGSQSKAPAAAAAGKGKAGKEKAVKEPKEKVVKEKAGKKVTKIHAKGPSASSSSQAGAGAIDPALQEAIEPIPVQFRLSPLSQLIGNHPRTWPGTLTARNVTALHLAAASKAGAAKVTSAQGVIKNEDGSEDTYQIDGNDELDFYLGAAGDKGTFVVVLEGGYA